MRKLLSFLAILLLASCSFEQPLSNPEVEIPQTRSDRQMIVGKPIANPYSLSNMQAAYNELCAVQFIPLQTLKPTDIYVRFLPADTTELGLLERDNLELFEYPLDREIVHEGDYYHDPTIPEGEITWQYTTVKPGYMFPDVRYEILD